MSWHNAALCALLAGIALGFICGAFDSRKPRNRRTGLPAPKPDSRDSLAEFKRLMQP